MTPDMDRLITAAEDAYQDACLPNEVLSQRTINAMVCAVLQELRKPSKEALAASAEAINYAVDLTEWSDGDGAMHSRISSDGYDYALPGIQAMIDHILAEPTAPR